MIRSLLAGAAALLSVPAAHAEVSPDLLPPDLLPLVEAAFAGAREDCAADGGTLELPVVLRHERVDLTGNGAPDLVLSEEGAFCGPDLGYLGAGTAGPRIHVVIDGQPQALLNGNWAVTDLTFRVEGEALNPVRVLVLAVHGSLCDSFGATPCFVAFAWDGERMRSIMDGAVHWADPAPADDP